MKIKNVKVKDLLALLKQIDPETLIDYEGDVYDVDGELGVNCDDLRLGLVRVQAGTPNAFGVNIQIWPDCYVVKTIET